MVNLIIGRGEPTQAMRDVLKQIPNSSRRESRRRIFEQDHVHDKIIAASWRAGGDQQYMVLTDTRGTYVDLRVPLNAAGRAALEAGDPIRVTFKSSPEARFPDIPAKRLLTFGFTAVR